MGTLPRGLVALLITLSTPALADTAETGKTGDTAETAETADTDTGDLQDAYTLAERTGESGGCGLEPKAALLIPGLTLRLALARRRMSR